VHFGDEDALGAGQVAVGDFEQIFVAREQVLMKRVNRRDSGAKKEKQQSLSN
jgi:hypothetical protein